MCHNSMWLTNWFVCHAHVSGSPAAKPTRKVVGLLHGCFGGVVGHGGRYVGGPCGQGVHATRAVKTVGTSAVKRECRRGFMDRFFPQSIKEYEDTYGWFFTESLLYKYRCCSPVLLQFGLGWGHVLQAARAVMRVHLNTIQCRTRLKCK